MSDPATNVVRQMKAHNTGKVEYTDGNGIPYSESLRRLSWSVQTDIPAIGQFSSAIQLPLLKEAYGLKDGVHFLHPTQYTKLRHTDHLSFAKTNSDLGVGILADPKAPTVIDRLYIGSRTMARPKQRVPMGRYEMAADVAFINCAPLNAVPLYSEQIARSGTVQPNIFAYEKRCAAYAELGRYREALQDAEFVLANCSSAELGSARMRVRAIKDFLKKVDNFEPGYHHAVSTLICLLRPREHRQVVPSSPSLYGRPETAPSIGKGLTGAASVGSLLAFDKDGDGNIDMDEFEAGILTLGYKAKKSDKKVFKGGPTQRGVI